MSYLTNFFAAGRGRLMYLITAAAPASPSFYVLEIDGVSRYQLEDGTGSYQME